MGDAPRSTPVRGTLLLAVIFFLGMISGAALFYMGQRSAPAGAVATGRRPSGSMYPGSMMRPEDQLAKELDLDPEQRRKIGEALRSSRTQLFEMMERTRLEVREQLRPDQQEKFDRQRPHRRGRRGGRFPRGGPGGTPGRRPQQPPPGDPQSP